VDLRIPDQQIDTTTAQGRLFFTILAAFEREHIRERTRDCLAATKARGRQGGREHRLDESKVALARNLRADGHSITDIGALQATASRSAGPQSTARWRLTSEHARSLDRAERLDDH
jgi:DNA invertase Pin-like site-specific DNA recombinase